MKISKMLTVVLQIITITTSRLCPLDINVNVTPMRKIAKTKRQELPQDISFVIADLKYDGKTVKILELGKGPHSGFQGHAQLYGHGKIWKKIWRYLDQFDAPVFYVGRPIRSTFRRKEISYPDFKRKCIFAKDFQELEQLPLFKKLCNSPLSPNRYVGTVLARYYQGEKRDITNFHQKYPQFLLFNKVVAPFVNDKYKTALLFEKIGKNAHRPQWKVYKKNTPNLAETINKDFPNIDTLVIKPFCAAHGNGINIVVKQDLAALLQHLFPQRSIADNYWLNHNNAQFLIEECVSSKPITVGHKQYDPTMRVIFILEQNLNAINLTFLGSYWKLPTKAINENGSLNKRLKSNISPNRISSAKVSKKDYRHVKQLLKEILPPLYACMIEQQASTNTVHAETHATHERGNTSEQTRRTEKSEQSKTHLHQDKNEEGLKKHC